MLFGKYICNNTNRVMSVFDKISDSEKKAATHYNNLFTERLLDAVFSSSKTVYGKDIKVGNVVAYSEYQSGITIGVVKNIKKYGKSFKVVVQYCPTSCKWKTTREANKMITSVIKIAESCYDYCRVLGIDANV